MLRDVETERRLSHGRSGRNNHEIRGLESRGELVEIVEAARDAGDRLAAALERLDALHRGPQQLLDTHETVGLPLLRDVENLRLGLVEQIGGGALPRECVMDDLCRDLDERPQDRFLADDLGVILHVRRRRHRVDEVADVVLSPRGFELSLTRELVGQREWIYDATALCDGDHRPKNPAMTFRVEHRVVDGFDRADDGVLVHEHRGQDGLFCVFGVWRLPIPEGITAQRRSDRVFDGRAGHLPKWGASTTGCAIRRPDGT